MSRTELLPLLFVLALAAPALAQEAPTPPREPAAADAGVAAPARTADGGGPAHPDEPAAAPAPRAVPSAAPPEGAATKPAPAAAAEPEATAGEAIVVTGSRIKQPSSSFSPAAPVDVIDRKELEKTGATNMADVVTYLTVS